MENIENIKEEYTFKDKRSRFIVIKGVEYQDHRKYQNDLQNILYIPTDRFDGLSILDEKDQDTFYQIVKEDSFIDGLRCRSKKYLYGVYYDTSYEEYKQIIKYILDKNDLKEEEKNICYWFEPIHIIRRSEINDRYNCRVSVVLNGEEINAWKDGDENSVLICYIGKCPGYIVLDGNQHISSIPPKELIIKETGNPKDIWVISKLIPKKFLDKIIIYKDEVDYSGNITGKSTRLVFDFKNPEPDVFDFMIKHGLCKKKEK